jgi:carbamoyltransferase
MANIAYYGSHNAAFAIEQDGKIISVIEVERFNGYKNSGIAQYKTPKHKGYSDFRDLVESIIEYVKDDFGIERFENCIVMNSDLVIDNILLRTHEAVPADNYLSYHHHMAHAAGTFYQSSYKEALAFSFDGGGDDGKFNIFHCIRGKDPILLERIASPAMEEHWLDYDLGFPYMLFGHYLKDINFEGLSEGNLVYSGKIMGLVSYGKVREEWMDDFIAFYKSDPNGTNYQEKIDVLGEAIGVKFDIGNRLEGELAYDIATTSQRAFEECFLEVAEPYFELFPDMPICITGGCGLNILLNTRLVTEFNKELFVGPNPNDCGLAVGMMAGFLKPKEPIDVTYAGLPIMDKYMFQYYFNGSSWWKDDLNIDEVIDDLAEGKIIGVVRDRSEHGPRALGNRSIICNPSFPEMKDILNAKVKHREWYRPFAPVVRLEDVNKYFEWDRDARWMSYAPVVRKKWRNKLAAITHVDNTARVQTVTREQNPWLYDLITKFEEKTGIGVILNTSFNVNRMPILTTLKDAFTVFEKTEMDTLIVEDKYIRKYMKL